MINLSKTAHILGIESSCDETAAAIIKFDENAKNAPQVLSNVVFSQTEQHLKFGGVVPEIASRAHMEKLTAIIDATLHESGLKLPQIDGISVTLGPGLLGGLLIGLTCAKSLAQSLEKPVIGVNHLEAHALTAHLTEKVPFPYTLLLISGGHCQFIRVEDLGKYTLLGSTIDDSIGECFDKVAKMLNLPYPGGPQIEKLASQGDSSRYTFPKPLLNKGLDFSFSGLKTALRRHIEQLSTGKNDLSEQEKADICASFQESVAQLLATKTAKVLKETKDVNFVLAGGVAANRLLRGRIQEACDAHNATFHAPPPELCTDNAVMVAYAGGLRLLRGESSSLDVSPRPRWPLSELS